PAAPIGVGARDSRPAPAAWFWCARNEKCAVAVTPRPRLLRGRSTEAGRGVAPLLPDSVTGSTSLTATLRRGASAIVRRIPGAPAVAKRVQRRVKGLLK